jgi:hypothetical protein
LGLRGNDLLLESLHGRFVADYRRCREGFRKC